jgi:hypothetical protein
VVLLTRASLVTWTHVIFPEAMNFLQMTEPQVAAPS